MKEFKLLNEQAINEARCDFEAWLKTGIHMRVNLNSF